MPENKVIDTSKYVREGKVDVDGNVWEVVLPGAGTELKISKVQRRLKFLDKKIEKGTETEADLDKYDEYEEYLLTFFKGLFKDGTEDNKSVSDWVESTPMAIIIQSFDDIKAQADSDPLSD